MSTPGICADVEQLVLEINQARENVRVLSKRVFRMWNRAGRHEALLSREERRALTLAMRKLLDAAKG